MHWIDQYIKSFAKTVTNTDAKGWFPGDLFGFDHYYADYYIDKLIVAHQKAKQKKVSPKELAQTFSGPLTLRGIKQFLMYGLQHSKHHQTKTANLLLNFFYDILRARCVDDFFGENSAKIHTNKEVKYIINKIPLDLESLESGQEVGRLISACSHLSWSLYTDYYYTQCYENFGPYNVSGGRVMLIRQYSNLKPLEVWPYLKKFLYNKVTIYTIYKNSSLKMNMWSHVISKINLPSTMEKYAIQVNGRFIKDSKRLIKIRKNVESVASKQHRRFIALNFEQIKKKVVELRYYIHKDFFTKLGMSWRPEKEVYDSIKNKKIILIKYPHFKSKKQAKKFWADFIDPRTKPWMK